ncbi:MAG: MoaD/ThiS family protein [Planctomycetaceae bacterium]
MNIAVRLFARARDLAGTDRLAIELSEPADVRQLKQQLGAQCPRLRPILPQLLVAVGTEYATNDTPLDGDADVACFPPVSGG